MDIYLQANYDLSSIHMLGVNFITVRYRTGIIHIVFPYDDEW